MHVPEHLSEGTQLMMLNDLVRKCWNEAKGGEARANMRGKS